jgi:penicillin G amidase
MVRLRYVSVVAAGVAVLFAAALMARIRLGDATTRLSERGTVLEEVPGLLSPLEVVVDHRGVPHVRASVETDLWFAEGYLHARERFFQMELARRVAGGRLAEIVGPPALPSDRRHRILRLEATAIRQAGQLGDAERAALDAYTAGVNAALARYGRWIAPEIWMIGFEPEPWRVEDSLAVGLLTELDLTGAMGDELRRSVELARYGRQRAVDLWGWTPDEARAWIPPVEPPAMPPRDDDAIIPSLGGFSSNNWALAGSRTASGRPILANDPHVGVSLPATWYLIHLDGPGIHVAGATIPGIPGVAIGHTERVAWGFTMAMADDQDLWVLRLDEGGQRERVDRGWQSLRTVAETIRVLGRPEPERLKVRLSDKGPIVRDGGREVIALTWSATLGPSAVGAFLAMCRAGSVAEVAQAWEGIPSPIMNLVAADSGGHILHQVVGEIPDRGRGAGRLPAPASDPRWAWRGLQPLVANPHRADPPEGFIATAGQDLFAEGNYPSREWFPGEFAPPWRYRRIRSALAARSDWDVASCVALQGDLVSSSAVSLLALIGSDLDRHGGRTAEILRNWDARVAADALAPHLAARLTLDLEEAVGGDEAFEAGLEGTPFGNVELQRLLAGGMSEAWWDDVRTLEHETRTSVIAAVLDRLDAEQPTRTWGEVHQVLFRHPLAATPLVGRLIGRVWSRGPFAVGGDGSTINAEYWSRRRPFGVIALPSLRFVTEVGDWDHTVMVLPTGQSGHPWSPYYDDELDAWLAVKPIVLPFSRGAVERAARSRLLLRPAGRHGSMRPPAPVGGS